MLHLSLRRRQTAGPLASGPFSPKTIAWNKEGSLSVLKDDFIQEVVGLIIEIFLHDRPKNLGVRNLVPLNF